ncbi:unnamed protein product [Sphagnum troendelagicum]|uniref:Uncharacterized protein n=1 Tax=Sphagnum troendelagicum TaxID=128251 RepID=A0ABP0UP12_9BRYO
MVSNSKLLIMVVALAIQVAYSPQFPQFLHVEGTINAEAHQLFEAMDTITGASLCTIPICNISFLLQVLTVCILFIRFSRIDATDSAVLRSTNRRSRRGLIFTPAPVHDVLSSTDTNTGPSVNKASATQDMACCISCCDGSCFPDNEWRKELSCFTDNESWGDCQPQHHEFVEEILFCSICKAEVF